MGLPCGLAYMHPEVGSVHIFLVTGVFLLSLKVTVSQCVPSKEFRPEEVKTSEFKCL